MQEQNKFFSEKAEDWQVDVDARLPIRDATERSSTVETYTAFVDVFCDENTFYIAVNIERPETYWLTSEKFLKINTKQPLK